MLDKMMQTQGNRHIIVFPERENTVLLFSLMRAIHNISTGRIEKKYTVDDFKVGDKLKLGNAVVEFLGISDMDGKNICRFIYLIQIAIIFLLKEHRYFKNRYKATFEWMA